MDKVNEITIGDKAFFCVLLDWTTIEQAKMNFKEIVEKALPKIKKYNLNKKKFKNYYPRFDKRYNEDISDSAEIKTHYKFEGLDSDGKRIFKITGKKLTLAEKLEIRKKNPQHYIEQKRLTTEKNGKQLLIRLNYSKIFYNKIKTTIELKRDKTKELIDFYNYMVKHPNIFDEFFNNELIISYLLNVENFNYSRDEYLYQFVINLLRDYAEFYRLSKNVNEKLLQQFKDKEIKLGFNDSKKNSILIEFGQELVRTLNKNNIIVGFKALYNPKFNIDAVKRYAKIQYNITI